VVGESGSGKSVTSHAIMGCCRQINFRRRRSRAVEGDDLLGIAGADAPHPRRPHRMIFQEPMTRFNPVMKAATRSPRC